MKNIIIYGAGMLGNYLYNMLMQKKNELKLNWNIILYPFEKVDITNKQQLEDTIIPDSIIINCAAYTNVDKAEKEKDLAYAVNADAVKNIAKLCKERNCKLVHISTDFVYGRNDFKTITENICLDPINIYGASKADGEDAVREILGIKNNLILRVAWTFGIYGNNFIRKIYEQLLDDNIKFLNVVDDQYGKPTSIPLISYVIYLYISDCLPSGTYNLTCPGNFVSKYDIAMYIKKYIGSNKQINKKMTKDFATIDSAPRQKNSMLDCSKIYKVLQSYLNINDWIWNTEIKKYIDELRVLKNE